MIKDAYKIQGKFRSIMALAIKLDRTPKKFGTDGNLSHAEIHLVEIIGDNKGMGVSDIARLIGITKGAVSQSLKRLEKKGITNKQTDPENLSRVIVGLTSKGNISYWAHKHWHEKMDGGFSVYLEKLSENDVSTILDFLSNMEDFLKLRLESPE